MFARQESRPSCSFPGCNKARRTKQLCQSHDAQLRRTGSVWPLGTSRRVRRTCDFEGCDKAAVNRVLPEPPQATEEGAAAMASPALLRQQGPCRFDDCSKPAAAGGYCAGHAAQYYGGRPLTPLFHPSPIATLPAAPSGTSRLATAKGHWRQLRPGRTLTPLREKLGRHVDRGYVSVFEPEHPNARKDGYLAEPSRLWRPSSADASSDWRRSITGSGGTGTVAADGHFTRLEHIFVGRRGRCRGGDTYLFHRGLRTEVRGPWLLRNALPALADEGGGWASRPDQQTRERAQLPS
jgi:hypothetical protein